MSADAVLAGGRAERRAATERALLDALIEVTLDVGFDRVTVEAVAQRAGCNKALLYRYFGGLDGMINALATDGDFFPDLDELCGGDVAGVQALAPRDRLIALLTGYGAALAARPVMGYLVLNSVVSDSSALRDLPALRSRQIRSMLRRLDLTSANVGLDLGALLHVWWSSFMVFAARDVRGDQIGPAWARVERLLISLVASAPPTTPVVHAKGAPS